MHYQVSVALEIKESNQIRGLLRRNGFKLHLRDTALGKFSPIELLDDQDFSGEGNRFYVYAIYNSDAGFPAQEVLKRLLESEHLLDVKLRHFTENSLLPS